jgi:hypothetical protein
MNDLFLCRELLVKARTCFFVLDCRIEHRDCCCIVCMQRQGFLMRLIRVFLLASDLLRVSDLLLLLRVYRTNGMVVARQVVLVCFV